jgi:hypothetical protein
MPPPLLFFSTHAPVQIHLHGCSEAMLYVYDLYTIPITACSPKMWHALSSSQQRHDLLFLV